MKSNFNSSLEILQSAQEELLYNRLLQQIKKDFTLANVELKISEGVEPVQLKDVLREKIYFLLLEKFQEYLNLLYVVDIPEKEMKKIHSLDAVDAATEVCFLVLKREWQKVWFKNKYNS
ncbi:hypothetical protein [Flagellimonas sp.]|uniref:hypothetical protein n=1 Tax=Flagellimonas sp. TaxID=2058762 RepID=UPI003B5C49E0